MKKLPLGGGIRARGHHRILWLEVIIESCGWLRASPKRPENRHYPIRPGRPMRRSSPPLPARPPKIQSPATCGHVWMPAFAGMTLKFLSHPPHFESLTRLARRSGSRRDRVPTGNAEGRSVGNDAARELLPARSSQLGPHGVFPFSPRPEGYKLDSTPDFRGPRSDPVAERDAGASEQNKSTVEVANEKSKQRPQGDSRRHRGARG
jgi:hypothetical protein